MKLMLERDNMLKKFEILAIPEEDKTSSKVGVDVGKSTVTWGMQLLLEREHLLKMFDTLAVQGEDKNFSQVGVNTDRFVVIRGKD